MTANELLAFTLFLSLHSSEISSTQEVVENPRSICHLHVAILTEDAVRKDLDFPEKVKMVDYFYVYYRDFSLPREQNLKM